MRGSPHMEMAEMLKLMISIDRAMLNLEQTMKRFEAVEDSPGAWKVIDKDHAQYDMTERAVSINMREATAHEIAGTLNDEWQQFLANPY